MPTLVELRAIKGPDGKRICGPDGQKLCRPCPRPGCCTPPQCLRVTMDFRVDGVDLNICGPGDGATPDDNYYPCHQVFPDMDLSGVALVNCSIDVVVPYVGTEGPSPHVDFNYYLAWEVNDPSICTQSAMDALGAHKNSRFVACEPENDFYVMSASVQVYCEPDGTDPSIGRYTLDVRYHLRRMSDSDPCGAGNTAEASMVVHGRYNWAPAATCDPFHWEIYGEDWLPAQGPHEGFNCSDNGRVQQGLFQPLCKISDVPGEGEIDRRLLLTWPCFDGTPWVIREWPCDEPLPEPPIGISPDPGVTPPTEPWQLACCPDRTQYATLIPGSITGAAAGFPFTPGCDECFSCPLVWTFEEDVGGVEFGHPGYVTGISIGATSCAAFIPPYTAVSIKVYCLDGFSWIAVAYWVGPNGNLQIDTLLQVPPCTPGHRDNYFEVVLIMNPGTGCAAGCPCYGGALAIGNG